MEGTEASNSNEVVQNASEISNNKNACGNSVGGKSRKSSNILSALVRRTRRKSNKHLKNTHTHLSQDVNFCKSLSSLGVHTEEEEVELNAENHTQSFDSNKEIKSKSLDDADLETVDSNHSFPQTLKSKHQFFRKILPKRSSSSEVTDMSLLPVFKLSSETVPKSHTDDILTSYVGLTVTISNPSLDISLQEVQNLVHRLQENEHHLVRTLTAFIRDPSLQKELVEMLFQHSKLQWETDRRTASLTNDMWLQQIDIGRTQERALQDTLTSLVKQNRQLQVENEILFRKLNKNNLKSDHLKVEQITQHNENLQSKLEAYHKEVERLETELKTLQKQNESVEQQFRHAASHIQNLKAMSARSKMGYELEIVSLNNDLHRVNKVITECDEMRTTFFAEFDCIKKQLISYSSTINWTKMSIKGDQTLDFIKLSRICLREFTNEIIRLNDNLSAQQECFQKSSIELNVINQKRLEELENKFKEKIEKIAEHHELEKTSLMNKLSEHEKSDNEITETKQVLSYMTTENTALRKEIERLLSETGAGDVGLTRYLCYYKSQYQHILNENQLLMEKLKHVESEINENRTREQINCQAYQKQLAEGEQQVLLLHQQYEREHDTIVTLQSERMKYLEEKVMLKTIFNHMKAELSRIQKLEGTVIDISKEANKLALVAEYNQKLGCRLKNELIEKDKTILQLKNSVERLNDIQIQHTKDKLSLCYELSEICQIRDHLSAILSAEVEKNTALDDSKKKILDSASLQIKQIEETRQNDRLTLKTALKELKSIIISKDVLEKENCKLKDDISRFKTAEAESVKKINEKNAIIERFTISSKADKDLLKTLESQTIRETNKYNKDLEQLKQLIIQLRKEKEQLDGSTKYLQNNTQKLFNDLNEVRKCEKELHDDLKQCMIEKQQLELQIKDIRKDFDISKTEKTKLISEVNHLNSFCEKMINSLETNMVTCVEKEELFKRELDDSQKLIISLSRDNDNLQSKLKDREQTIEELQRNLTDLEYKAEQHSEARNSKNSLQNEIVDLKNENTRLSKELEESKISSETITMTLEQAQQSLMFLENQFRTLIDEKKMNDLFHQQKCDQLVKQIEEIQKCNQFEVDNLKLQIADLSERLEQETSSYAALSEVYKEISAKFLQTIKDLVEEKKLRQDDMSRYEESLQIVSCERDNLHNQLHQRQVEIDKLNEEKVGLQRHLEEIQEALKKRFSFENKSVSPGMQENVNQLQAEFQKSDLTLQLHELQKKFQTEQQFCQQLKNTHRMILDTVLQMRDEEKIQPNECNQLIQLVQNNFVPNES